MNNIVIGKLIRQQREIQDLTIAEVAEKVNISDNYLGNIERGKQTPSFNVILNIANALDVSVDFLLGSNLQFNRNISAEDMVYKVLLKTLSDMNASQKMILLDCAKSLLKHS